MLMMSAYFYIRSKRPELLYHLYVLTVVTLGRVERTFKLLATELDWLCDRAVRGAERLLPHNRPGCAAEQTCLFSPPQQTLKQLCKFATCFA